MAFACEFCGFRSTEVKPSGGISEKGFNPPPPLMMTCEGGG